MHGWIYIQIKIYKNIHTTFELPPTAAWEIEFLLCFLFLIWLNFKSISVSSTHGLNAIRKLKRQQEIRMSQCKRTTNCLALHLQLKYKRPIKGSFHFSFVCTCTGGEGKKKAIFACNFRNCFKCNSSSYSQRIKNFWSYSWPTLFVY